MEPNEAASVRAQAATTLIQALKDAKSQYDLQQLAQTLVVGSRIEAKDAAQLAATLLAMTKTSEPATLQGVAQSLSVILSDNDPASQLAAGVHLSTAVGSVADAGQPLNALAPLIPGAEPFPCRLSTQQLVELLKMPTCVGPARRVVLDHLGNRYQRPFADVWEFVRFAEEQKLGLDFTSPPQRPE
jgi:hypothetical protein